MKLVAQRSAFDVVFDTDTCTRGPKGSNAFLGIKLKLGFTQVNPPDGKSEGIVSGINDEPIHVEKWTSQSWLKWQTDFVRATAPAWNRKFWLINNGTSFAFRHNGRVYVPNIVCGFKIEIGLPDSPGNHRNIKVVRLPEDSGHIRSNTNQFSSKDHIPNVKAYKTSQMTSAHEIGHLLGFEHPRLGKFGCPTHKDPSRRLCYGITRREIMSIMGLGSQLYPEHAKPWMDSLRHIQSILSGMGPVVTRSEKVGTNSRNPMRFNPVKFINAPWDVSMRYSPPRVLTHTQVHNLGGFRHPMSSSFAG